MLATHLNEFTSKLIRVIEFIREFILEHMGGEYICEMTHPNNILTPPHLTIRKIKTTEDVEATFENLLDGPDMHVIALALEFFMTKAVFGAMGYVVDIIDTKKAESFKISVS